MSNIQIETDLKEILRELKEGQQAIITKIDNLDHKVDDIDKRLVRVETKLDNTVGDIKELKDSSNAQIWTLIGILITAVGGFLVAVGRFVFTTV